MKTIATPEDIRNRGRQIGKIDDARLQSFINEVEMTIVRKKLGDKLYLQIINTDEEQMSQELSTLVNGGTYTLNGEENMLIGIKTAISYYVYAQNVLAGDYISTRYGMRIKEDDYSQGLTQKDRAEIAGSATDIANAYMEECLEYCDNMGIEYSNGRSMQITSGCIIRKISSPNN